MRGPFPIAINASFVGSWPSGIGRYAVEVTRALASLGVDLAVHTAHPAAFALPSGMLHTAPAVIRPEGGALAHVARLAWCQTGLRARVAGGRARVLFNTQPEGILASRVPQVTAVHDLVPRLFPREYPRQQWYFRRWVPAILRASRVVITGSEATRAHAMSAYGLPPERIRVVPYGYDSARFYPGGPQASGGETPYVLYVGNLLPHKNVHRLIDAVALVSRHEPLRLVIAGHGRAAAISGIKQLAARVEAPIDLRGYVSDDELPALYRGARAVVLPSLAEGFGLPALEAMACGAPIVASNTGALAEVVGDAGVLIDPTDTAAIAEALRRIVVDDGLRADLHARGLARAGVFSWHRTARAILAELEEAGAAP